MLLIYSLRALTSLLRILGVLNGSLGLDPDCFCNVQTGAMRIGKDAVILTQTKDTCSMGFLSKSFNSSLEVRSLLNVSCFT